MWLVGSVHCLWWYSTRGGGGRAHPISSLLFFSIHFDILVLFQSQSFLLLHLKFINSPDRRHDHLHLHNSSMCWRNEFWIINSCGQSCLQIILMSIILDLKYFRNYPVIAVWLCQLNRCMTAQRSPSIYLVNLTHKDLIHCCNGICCNYIATRCLYIFMVRFLIAVD